MNSSNATRSYFSYYIPPSIQIDLKAGAFESLCRHLQERSREVSNIDMMAVSGFCRNCLAKWLVLDARRLVTRMKVEARSGTAGILEQQQLCSRTPSTQSNFGDLNAVALLNAFGYDEAAEYVYGCGYAEWKKRYQAKATEAQLLAFDSRKFMHAQHDTILMEPLLSDESSCNKNNNLFSRDHNYFLTLFSTKIQKQLQAGAFDSICEHLQQHSQHVSNIDMMTVAGFCRNCLAKWLVMEARSISSRQHTAANRTTQVLRLDAFGYEDAAEVVYGCTYGDWKARYHVEATEEQMKAYHQSSHMHATHDKAVLKERGVKENVLAGAALGKEKDDGGSTIIQSTTPPVAKQFLSNVCCQDVDFMDITDNRATKKPDGSTTSHSDDPLFTPVPPPIDGVALRIGVLTVSDRSFTKQYVSGDLSGPAVLRTIESTLERINSLGPSSTSIVSCDVVQRGIVPDEQSIISKTLKLWSVHCNLIFTTGGTGFAPRDVTPEATLQILEKECHGLMTWASIECSSTQPLASLSRGTAGICGSCIIVNLPGSPVGAAQVTMVLLPLLVHAVKDVNIAPLQY